MNERNGVKQKTDRSISSAGRKTDRALARFRFAFLRNPGLAVAKDGIHAPFGDRASTDGVLNGFHFPEPSGELFVVKNDFIVAPASRRRFIKRALDCHDSVALFFLLLYLFFSVFARGT